MVFAIQADSRGPQEVGAGAGLQGDHRYFEVRGAENPETAGKMADFMAQRTCESK